RVRHESVAGWRLDSVYGEKAPPPGHALELMWAAVAERDARADNDVLHGARHNDLVGTGAVQPWRDRYGPLKGAIFEVHASRFARSARQHPRLERGEAQARFKAVVQQPEVLLLLGGRVHGVAQLVVGPAFQVGELRIEHPHALF